MSLNSGYDFIAEKFSPTQLTAGFDMHCFNIQVSLVPFGTLKQYSFRIQANAASLADLLRFRKSSSPWDN